MMREMFNVADTNKDNTLSLTEFETFLEQQGGVRVEHMRVKSMFDEMSFPPFPGHWTNQCTLNEGTDDTCIGKNIAVLGDPPPKRASTPEGESGLQAGKDKDGHKS